MQDLDVIGVELFILLANIRLLWMKWNNCIEKQVDVRWIARINVYVRDVFIGSNEKFIRIDLKLSNFFTDGCHWIINKGIRKAFSDGCVSLGLFNSRMFFLLLHIFLHDFHVNLCVKFNLLCKMVPLKNKKYL